MRWFAIFIAVGLAVQLVASADAASRSFIRQCERQGLEQGTPEFKACISKKEAAVKRQHRAEANWSP